MYSCQLALVASYVPLRVIFCLVALTHTLYTSGWCQSDTSPFPLSLSLSLSLPCPSASILCSPLCLSPVAAVGGVAGTLAPVAVGSGAGGGSLAELGPAPSPGSVVGLCLSIRALRDGMELRYSSRAPMSTFLSRLAVAAVDPSVPPAVVSAAPVTVADAVALVLSVIACQIAGGGWCKMRDGSFLLFSQRETWLRVKSQGAHAL